MPNFSYFINQKLHDAFNDNNGPINPNANTGNEVLDKIINLGLPLVLFGFLGWASFHYIRLIQKGKLDLRETITWIIWNIILMIVSIYLILIYILDTAGIKVSNFLNVLAAWLGIASGTQQWLMMMFLFFIAFLYAKAFSHAIKISQLKKRNDTLARELAILKGRFESTVDKEPMNSPSLVLEPSTTEEIKAFKKKHDLENDFKG